MILNTSELLFPQDKSLFGKLDSTNVSTAKLSSSDHSKQIIFSRRNMYRVYSDWVFLLFFDSRTMMGIDPRHDVFPDVLIIVKLFTSMINRF